jgi:uncharacterized protein (TIGR00369 family)
MNIDNKEIDQASKTGSIPPEMFMKHSGMELMDMMIAGELAGPSIARLLNFFLAEAQPGHVIFRGTPTLDHYNPAGTVHGGWATTLMDSALGCAVQTMLPKAVIFTTIEIKVNLVRPLFADSGEVRCEGNLVHLGRTIATSEAKLTRGDGKLIAHGTSTCAIIKPSE